MKPILKWAGGKSVLLPEIKKLMPDAFNTYYEPFFGGGAVFFDIEVEKAVINDINSELMNLYTQVRDNCDKLIPLLDELERSHSETKYYELRSIFNLRKTTGQLDEYDAALMLYLNKAGFNGMYRENKSGNFNIPSGQKKKVKLYDLNNIHEVSSKLKCATIKNVDFEKAVEDAKEGDFIYFDSPYDETFNSYQKGGFSKEEHERLANLCHRLTDRNVFFLLSSSDSDFIRDLYSDYDITTVEVNRLIRFRSNQKVVTEFLIKNY